MRRTDTFVGVNFTERTKRGAVLNGNGSPQGALPIGRLLSSTIEEVRRILEEGVCPDAVGPHDEYKRRMRRE
jgi:hypothetical protein